MGEPRDTASGPDLGADTLSDALPLRRSQLIERGTAIGRYVVIESVGSGGMSTVYAAYDPELDRRVALKVMRATSEDSETVQESERGRLLREAQAMARLSHPNVVTVHDVGTFAERVFLAMHFVDGETLTTWVRRTRSWRETVEMYGYAGRGLAAAHKVGLVHRDFKPDNVLVDGENRVRVTDFGLARPIAGALASETPTSTPISVMSSSSRLERPITLAGSIMGTPAYMAPEQYLGQGVDARTDQFSFCVSLWEALVGERPFPGETLGEVAHSVTRGRTKPFPAKSPVSARVRRALERGLSRRPDDRFADMDELLRELAPASRRRPLLVVGAALGLVAGGAAATGLGLGLDPGTPCAGASAGLDLTWNENRRDSVAGALAAAPDLDESARSRALALVDGYAEGWRASALDACVRNKVTHNESDSAFEARSRCLQRRRDDLERELVRVEHGTQGSIAAALVGLHSLIQPSVCDDTEILLQTTPLPDDPESREIIDQLYDRAARLDAALVLGNSAELGHEVEEILLEARRSGWPPMLARAYWLEAQLRSASGDVAGAEQSLYAMTLAAASGHDSEQLIRGWIDLTYLVGQMQGRIGEGLQLAHVGEVEIIRAGYSYDTIRLLTAKGAVYQAGNDRTKARETWQRALGMTDAESTPRPAVRAVLLNNLGTLDLVEGDALAALERFREARDLSAELYGPNYPWLADNYLNMCEAHTLRGQFQQALVECEQAKSLTDRPGAEKAARARVLHGLVTPTLGVGELERAQSLADEALVALRESYGEHSYSHAAAELAVAMVAMDRRDSATARAHALAAEQMLRELGPAFESMRSQPQWMLGVIAFGDGDVETALARCTEALELGEPGLGHDHPGLLEPLACRGAALTELGRPGEARALLERALAIHARSGGDPLAVSHARYALAEVVLAVDHDAARARGLVVDARRDLDPVNARIAGFAKLLDAWLEAHR